MQVNLVLWYSFEKYHARWDLYLNVVSSPRGRYHEDVNANAKCEIERDTSAAPNRSIFYARRVNSAVSDETENKKITVTVQCDRRKKRGR